MVSTVLMKSVRFFIIDLISCKASSEEKELAKLSCLNDSETQERGLWEVKIENIFPLGQAPGPPKACAFGARLGNRSVLILDPHLLRVFVLVSL